jgi:CheY-like chemotaxis protein
MSQMRIFVSHSSQDNDFCRPLVAALHKAGADVWFDEESLGPGRLLRTITSELVSRSVFIVILSKAAFNSTWVTQECEWAYTLYIKEPDRVILPVTAQQITPSDFNAWLFMESFKRIEGPGGTPLPEGELIAKTLDALAISNDPSPSIPSSNRTVLWVDDNPSNNFRERRMLEKLGISVSISTNTDDALGKLVRNQYAAIISDMNRDTDNLAGYTLLEHAQRIYAHNLRAKAPFIIYASSERSEYVEEAKRRGAFGQTSTPSSLIELVKQALGMS